MDKKLIRHKNQINIKGEISGSIGDLGTFLPYVVGAITICGLDVTGVLFMFGLMYIFTGWFYRVPVPVQPMKVIGAAILVHHLTAGEVAAAGYMIAITLLFLAATGLADKIADLTPASVTAGIQAGLGISLAVLGVKYMYTDLFIGLFVALVMLFLLSGTKIPASIAGVIGGTLLAFILHPEMNLPHLSPGFYLPSITLPEWPDFIRGFTLAYLPQMPLTLTNSILVTAALAGDLYPGKAQRVTEKNLCLTLGIGNLIAMPLGGLMMCHGSGGMAAHHRFGGRTGLTPAIIGAALLFIALAFGPSGIEILTLIPQAVLGSLLLFSGIDLATAAVGTRASRDIYTFVLVIVLSVAINPFIAFAGGLILHFLLNRGWIKI